MFGKTVVVLLALFAHMAVAWNCSFGGTNYLSVGIDTVSCTAPNSGRYVDTTFVVNDLLTCNVEATGTWSLPDSRTFVSVSAGSINIGNMKSPPDSFDRVDGARVLFRATSNCAMQMKYKCWKPQLGQPLIPVVSGQRVRFENKSIGGGFIYFSTGAQRDGTSLTFTIEVDGYTGIQPPTVLFGVNRLPTLESFDGNLVLRNNGTVNAGTSTFMYPSNSATIAGVYMYGKFSSGIVGAQWLYNYQTIRIGQVSKFQGGGCCSQFSVAPATKWAYVQVSREVPGGYNFITIGRGRIGEDYTVDTSKNDYQTVKIEDAYQDSAENPGLWIMCAAKSNGTVVILVKTNETAVS